MYYSEIDLIYENIKNKYFNKSCYLIKLKKWFKIIMFLTNFFTIFISTKTTMMTNNIADIHTNISFSEFFFSAFTLFFEIELLDFEYIFAITEVSTKSVIFVVSNLFYVDFCFKFVLVVTILVVGILIVVLIGSFISFILVED